jgi:hypothetical protein
MSTTEFCVYNQTRASFLTPRVTVIDAQSEPLKAVKALIEGLAPDAIAGLWLNPLKSIPTVPRLSAYDLVYLDQEGRVVHGVELAPDADAPSFNGAASALVLPAHSFAASQTLPGDRVVVRPVDEQAFSFVPVATRTSAAPLSSRIESPIAESGSAALPKVAASADVPEPAAPTLSVFTAIQRLQPLAWSLPSAAFRGPGSPALAQPLGTPAPIPSMTAAAEAHSSVAPKRSRFEFLRSVVHLRIRVQVSISTASPAASNPNPVSLTVEERPASAPPERMFRLGFSRAALQSMATAGSSSLATQWSVFRTHLRKSRAALARHASSFATVTMPIFFEHTVPIRAARVRRVVSGSYDACKGRYLRWAEAFMFRPVDASSVPRIFHIHPARRDRR